MTRTEAQNRAQARYNKQNVKTVAVSFYPKDIELYEYLNNKNNKAGFIKNLIREAYERENK